MKSKEEKMKRNKGTDLNPYTIPVAILGAGLLIAGAVYFGGGNSAPAGTGLERTAPSEPNVENMAPVSSDDHILGSPDAELIIVEYSDLECPFCKQFHETLLRVIDQYDETEVAWVFRHFPLTQLHSKADEAAIASECAASLGGNEGFWQYVNRYFELTPSNDGINLDQLPDIAAEVGLDRQEFEACLADNNFAAKVQAHFDDARSAGGTGTPFNVFVTKDGERISFSGAVPFEQLQEGIDQLLARQGE